jgi:hypothetical protein
MTCDGFRHVMKEFYFQNNQNPPDRTNPDYDRLCKIKRTFHYLSNAYSTLYNPTQNLAMDKEIAQFKGRVVFQ